ncbi:MAG: hypothetical protein EBZ89_13815 [Chloroflexi bacterium]|nr:hypothetical protein [Chloroflexota bacterium]
MIRMQAAAVLGGLMAAALLLGSPLAAAQTAERTLAQTCMSGRSKSVRMPQQRQANGRQRRVRRNTKVTTVVVCHETAHERPPSSARPHLVGFRYRPRNCSTPHRLNGEHPAWRSAVRDIGGAAQKGSAPMLHLVIDGFVDDAAVLGQVEPIFDLLNELPGMIEMTKITQPHVFRYHGVVPEWASGTGRGTVRPHTA